MTGASLNWKNAAALTTILVICAIQAFGQAPPELKEKHIKALVTGDASGLSVSESDSRTVKLAKQWTAIAVEMFSFAHAKVHEQSAPNQSVHYGRFVSD